MTDASSMRTTTETQVNVGRKYKSRKERPCDACRKRKICCTRDASEKNCSLCRTRGETCEYVLPPNVRRNRPSNARSRETMSSASSTSFTPPRPVPSCAGARITAPRHRMTAPSEWICQFVGFSGDQDPFVLRHCSFNQLNCYKAPDWAILRVKGESEIPLHFTVVPDSHLDPHPHYYPKTDTESIVAPHTEKLLRTYFDVIHMSYPLLDPARFKSKPQTGDPLLAVMYNLASPFCQDTPTSFQQLSDFVHQALPIERRHSRLETIEAYLLHLQRHSTIDPVSTLPSLWSDIGAIVGMAHDLGLNLDPTGWSLSPSDSDRRIRIWWALYIQDKWGALDLGRPSYLNDEHCSVPLPIVDNFSQTGLHNQPLPLTSAIQFVAMAHLTTILSDILNTFYTLKAMERIKLLPLEVLYSILGDFQGRLASWNQEHLCQLYNANTLLDSSGSVVLAYHTCEIVLYRAVLRCLPMGTPGYDDVREHAKASLLQIVGFVEKLNVSRLRAFWWSPMTRINFALAGTFMFFQLLTSITTHDIEFWSNIISHYRSLLRLQSHSFDMTKLACTRMDLLAAGMGVDPPVKEGERIGEISGDGRKVVLMPGSAEEWIARQGHEGMLLC
ncbi:Fungal specific transcription factor domain containing protein [Hyaloscypha variabilis]